MKTSYTPLLLCMSLIGLLLSLNPGKEAHAQNRSYAYGSIDTTTLFDDYPDFNRRAEEYSVNSNAAELLKALDKEVRIKTFLATWCPDSKKHVPSMINFLNAADNSNIRMEMTAVDYDKHAPDSSAREHHINYVPTFIFYHGNEEIGRIVETPEPTVEQQSVSILREAGLLK